jgi:BirA family biotin operon repressor/biotin-[acetyl-CoA-carboxylase] ligase
VIGWQIQSFELLDSTQRWLRAQAQNCDEGTVVLARQQRHGYGRQGQWISEPGGLYVSWLLKPPRLLPQLPWLLLLSVCLALEQETGLVLTLKLPNDLLIQNRKLAGMLIDTSIQADRPLYYVCGLGLNLNQSHFPELSDGLPPTSLLLETGQHWSEQRMLCAILTTFAAAYQFLCQDANAWLQSLQALAGRAVQISYNTQETKPLGALLQA